MAATLLTVTTMTKAGVNMPGQVTGSGSNIPYRFQNDGMTLVEVENLNAAGRVLTILAQAQIGGYAVANLAITVPATSKRWIGPFRPDIYNIQSGANAGQVELSIVGGQEADFKFRVFQLG